MSEALIVTNSRTETLAERNAEIMKAYNRLKCEEQIVNFGGRRIAINLHYNQILRILGKTYFLSPRRVEHIIGELKPKMAPLKPATKPVPEAQATMTVAA